MAIGRLVYSPEVCWFSSSIIAALDKVSILIRVIRDIRFLSKPQISADDFPEKSLFHHEATKNTKVHEAALDDFRVPWCTSWL
jgi:hypothetical protein